MKKVTVFVSLFLIVTFHTDLVAGDYQQQLEHIESIRISDIPKAKQLLDKLAVDFEALSNEEKTKYLLLKSNSEALRGFYQNSIDAANQVKNYTDNYNWIAKAESYHIIGLMHLGEYQEGFILLYNLLEKLELVDNSKVKQGILQNALTIHTYSGLLGKAQELARQAKAFAIRYKDDEYFCRANVEMALLYIKFEELALAKNDLVDADKLCRESNEIFSLFIIESQVALIDKLNGNFKLARKGYEDLYKKLVTFGWEGLLVDTQIRMSELYFEMDELDDIEKYALPAFQSSKKNNLLHDLADVSLVLAKYYEKTQQATKAKLFRGEYLKAAEELSSQLQKKRIAYYQAMNVRKMRRVP